MLRRTTALPRQSSPHLDLGPIPRGLILKRHTWWWERTDDVGKAPSWLSFSFKDQRHAVLDENAGADEFDGCLRNDDICFGGHHVLKGNFQALFICG